MTRARDEITAVLAQLSEIYPDMRFGQLVSNIVFWARGPEGEGTWDVADPLFLETARRHLERRCRQLEIEPSSVSGAVAPSRASVFRAVEDLGRRHTEQPFAELIAQVAEWAGVTVYDIEDELLLETARGNRTTQPHS